MRLLIYKKDRKNPFCITEEIPVNEVSYNFIWNNYLETGREGMLKLPGGRVINSWGIIDITDELPDELMELPEHKNTKIPEKGIEYLRKVLNSKLKQ